MGKDICVLDVRSDAVTVATGSGSGKGIISISGIKSETYDGYGEGEWYNTASLEDAVVKAFNTLPSHGNFDVLYVGVPSAFCEFYADENLTALNEDSVITRNIADKAAARGLEVLNKTRNVIQHCALGYRVDGGDVVYNPVGMSGRTMTTYNSYLSCKKGFYDAVDRIASALNFAGTEYISSAHAEGLTLLDDSYRAGGEVLVDFGFLECSLAGVRGDGLQGLESVTTGSAIIAAELTERLDVDFYSALSLLGQIDLTDDFEQVSFYSLPKDGDVLKYRASDINEIVRSCLREVAGEINNVFDNVADAQSIRRIFATGNAFFNMKGAIKYLAKSMGRAITPLAPNVPGYDKPEYSSLISVMRQAHLRKSERSFFSKFINRLRRV